MASTRKKPSPEALAGRVAAWLQHRLPELPQGHPIQLCLGLSGGLDSMVLLDVLAGLREPLGFSLSALHVHHGLQAAADDWAAFVERECAARAVPCTVQRVQVAAAGNGIEAAARTARHAAFAGHLASLDSPARAMLVAHHRGDQAETVLHHLLRGNGLAGLAGMPPARQFAGGARLWRPLLDETRDTLQAWAASRGLAWVDDPSNAELQYTRNRLRHAVLPPLVTHFPHTEAALARVARHAAEASELLADLAALDLHRAVSGDGYAPATLRFLPERRQRNALRHWLGQHGVQPDAAVFDNLWVSLASLNEESALTIKVGEYCVRAYRQRLFVTPAHLHSGKPYPLHGDQPADALARAAGWSLAPCWRQQERGLALRHLQQGLTVRARRDDDVLLVRGLHRQFKKLCQEAGIPPWLRAVLPVLEIGGELAAIAGVAVDDRFAAAAGEEGWWPGICGAVDGDQFSPRNIEFP